MDELVRVRRRVEKKGVKVIDFTRLSPDLPLPDSTVEEEERETKESSIRRAIAAKLMDSRGIRVNPDHGIILLPRVEEGFRFLTLAFVNPGDIVLLPDPSDPAYRIAAVCAGGWPVTYPLLDSRRFLPDIERIEPEAAFRAKILFAGFPGRPTGAVADADLFGDLIRLASHKNIVVAHDASLAGACLTGESCSGLLDHPEGMGLGVELHALAPLHDTGGWRPGFAVGNREIIFAMKTIQSQLQSTPVDEILPLFNRTLAVTDAEKASAASVYLERQRKVIEGLSEIDYDVSAPRAGFDLWIRVPYGSHSVRFASVLLRKAGLAVIPGVAFGEFGHDYVLISLTTGMESIGIALDRVKRLMPVRGSLRGWIRNRRGRNG